MLIDSQFKVGALNNLGSLNTSMTRNSPCYPSVAMEGFFRAASSPGVCYLSRREALPTRIFWVIWGIFICMRGLCCTLSARHSQVCVILSGYGLIGTFFWSALRDWEARPDITTIQLLSRSIRELR